MPDKMSQGEDRPAARLRRRGRRGADRRRARLARVLLPRRRPPGRGDPRRLPAQPVLQPGQPRGALRDRPGPSCGSRPAGASRTSSPASAPAARSPAPGATSRSATPTWSDHRRGPGRLDLLRRRGAVKPYLVEGVGEDFWPGTFDPSVVDRWVTVSDKDSFLTTRRLAAGGGHPRRRLGRHRAVRRAAGRPREIDDPDAMIAVILPDGGRSYLSKVFSDAWMTQYGFLERAADLTVGDVLRAQARGRRDPAARDGADPQSVRDAVALLHEHRVSQLPVVSAARPGHAVVGSIGERGLLKHAVDDPALLHAEIVDVMEPPFAAVAAERPGARGRRAAGRRAPGAAGHRATAARRASSRAPTCSKRSRDEPAPAGLRHAGGPRGARARPDVRLGHPRDPPDVDLRAAGPGEFVEDFDYARSANPTRSALETRAGRARGRARDGLRLRHGGDARAADRGRPGRAHTSCCPATCTAAPTASSTRS